MSFTQATLWIGAPRSESPSIAPTKDDNETWHLQLQQKKALFGPLNRPGVGGKADGQDTEKTGTLNLNSGFAGLKKFYDSAWWVQKSKIQNKTHNKFSQFYYQNFDGVWRVWNHQVTQFLS